MMMRTTRRAEDGPVRVSLGSPGRWLARIGLFAFLVAAPALCVAQRRGHGWAGGARGGFSAMPQQRDFRAPQMRPYQGRAGFERGSERGPAMRVANRRNFRPQQGQDARRPPEQNRRPERLQTRQQSSPESRRQSPENRQQPRPEYPQQSRTGVGRNPSPPMRRGQEHLPQWWQAHRGLSPRQQADALRRQPGFGSLPRGQQQRLIHRLRDFDRRSPAEQQRTLDRVEMFEHLSPERRQEVRGASEALSRMPPNRQRLMRQAFHELRQMPPNERQQMLHSSYGAQFTPRERTVLGNLLSIEPYQPQEQVIQPYFGKR